MTGWVTARARQLSWRVTAVPFQVSRRSMGAGCAGAAMLILAAAAQPRAWPLAVFGAAGLVFALPARWPIVGTFTALMAVVLSGFAIAVDRMHPFLAGAEGMLILTYLLALDHAETELTGRPGWWTRDRLAMLALGAVAAAATALAGSASLAPSVWLTAAGAVAVGAALLAAAG